MTHPSFLAERPLAIPMAGLELSGSVGVPPRPAALFVLGNDHGSALRQPHLVGLARGLRRRGFATLLLDLLPPHGGAAPQPRLDPSWLGRRWSAVHDWVTMQPALADLPVVYLGLEAAGTGALCAAAGRDAQPAAVITVGARPDQVGLALEYVQAPTLLLVGGEDPALAARTRSALDLFGCERRMVVVPHAAGRFEGDGARAELLRLAARWVRLHLPGAAATDRRRHG